MPKLQLALNEGWVLSSSSGYKSEEVEIEVTMVSEI